MRDLTLDEIGNVYGACGRGGNWGRHSHGCGSYGTGSKKKKSGSKRKKSGSKKKRSGSHRRYRRGYGC